MRYRILIAVLLFCTPFLGLAQQSSLSKDSLQTLIEQHPNRDSARVNALIDIQAHFLVDEHEKGKAYIEEAIEIAREIDYQTGIGFSLNALGAYYLRQGNTQKALEKTLEAIEIFEAINENQNIFAAYNNLALIYRQLEKYDKTIEVYENMLKRLDGRTESPSFIPVYFNIATTYQTLGDLDNYKVWIERMLATSEKLKFPIGIIEAKLGLAQIATLNGHFEEAIDRTKQVLKTVEEMGGVAQAEARAYKRLGTAYTGLGQYSSARANLQKSLTIYKTINSGNDIAELYLNLSSTEAAAGNYKAALEARTRHHAVKDSLLSEKQLAMIEELQTKYETEKIEREKESAELQNLKLTEENRRNRNLLLGTFGFILLASLGVFGFIRQQRLKKQAELSELELKETQKRLAIEQQKRQAELKAVRSQLNPHFIFNLMNSVQEMNLSGEPQKANRTLSNIAGLMRKTLANSQQETITLEEELELVRLYLDAESIRFEEKLNYDIVLDDEVEAEFIPVPPMLIQPYVENAVKHGLRHKKEGGSLIIAAELDPEDEDQLRITITDNGVGRKRAEELQQYHPDAHIGFSTQANSERLANIAAETGKVAGVEIEDLYDKDNEPAGTKVIITLPIMVAVA